MAQSSMFLVTLWVESSELPNLIDQLQDDDPSPPRPQAVKASSIVVQGPSQATANSSIVNTVTNAAGKSVTQISIPASQVLQPHILKSLQTLQQSPSKQGGDSAATQQQVIKLVSVSQPIGVNI